MVNKQKGIVLTCCLLVILTTFLAYFLFCIDLWNVKIQWVSLLCLLLSEAIFTGKFLMMRYQTVFSETYITSSAIHFLASLVIAIVFVVGNGESVKFYILINAILSSCLVIFDLLLFHFQKHISETTRQKLKAQELLNKFLTQIRELFPYCKGTVYYTGICEIEELLKYSDDTAMTGEELKIQELVMELSGMLVGEVDNSDTILAKIAEIKTVINNRTNQMRYIKRGSY